MFTTSPSNYHSATEHTPSTLSTSWIELCLFVFWCGGGWECYVIQELIRKGGKRRTVTDENECEPCRSSLMCQEGERSKKQCTQDRLVMRSSLYASLYVSVSGQSTLSNRYTFSTLVNLFSPFTSLASGLILQQEMDVFYASFDPLLDSTWFTRERKDERGLSTRVYIIRLFS